MVLAIFDLDHTLIAGDSDYLWGQYLVEIGVVAGDYHRLENERFYQQYQDGVLDIDAFLNFQLKPLADNEVQDLLRWRSAFIKERITPLLLPQAQALIAAHRTQAHTLLIITSTNRFITEPIAKLLGVDHLLATEPEFCAGKYTGRSVGVPCFAGGKVTRLQEWLSSQAIHPQEMWGYSDSHNDLPLLNYVTRPVAVDPDPALYQEATQRGWPIVSLRG